LNKEVGEAAGGLVGRIPLAGELRVRVLLEEVAVVGEGVTKDIEAVPIVIRIRLIVLVPAIVAGVVALSGRVVPCSESLRPGRLNARYCTQSTNQEAKKHYQEYEEQLI
jgi:hypothetical protein